MAARKLRICDPISEQRSQQTLTERRGQLNPEYKFNQFLSEFSDPRLGQPCPDGEMRPHVAGYNKTANDESLARDEGGGRNP